MNREPLTKPDAAVLQQVAEVVEHGFLVLSTDATEVTQETTAVGHHLREGDFLEQTSNRQGTDQSTLFYSAFQMLHSERDRK